MSILRPQYPSTYDFTKLLSSHEVLIKAYYMTFLFPVRVLHDLHNSHPFRPGLHNVFNQFKTKFRQVSTSEKQKLNFKYFITNYRNMVKYIHYKTPSNALDSTTHTDVVIVCDKGRGRSLTLDSKFRFLLL